ncbi:MAG: FMN-binding negative transcriptional regulator [Gammaproteobacteria bacterium]|nr:FMN-binding negative transcriptional regulator [Gammaproteobacteria bacterium]
MFNPKHFRITDQEEILAFLQRYNFGELISLVDGQLTATHLPFMADDEGRALYCHLARANPQWRSLQEQRVLITLRGPHDYISPTWYRNPGVPTWNYQVLHVYGHCRVFDDPAEVSQLVDRLAAIHEAGSQRPWQPDYPDSMLKAIVGVEIEIDELQCKYKLSQNRPAADHLPVVEQLERRGAGELAAAMRRLLDLESG